MAGQRRHLALLREAVAGAAALAISIAVVAHVAGSQRGVLLYSDGDSLITTLVIRSLAAGEPQDWAMSSVLFLPEIAVLGLLSQFGLPIMATLTVNAVVNLLGLYASLRFVAGRLATAPAAAGLAAFVAYCGLVLLETSPSRTSLELASLMLTTTYYSSTVIGMLLAIGLLVRLDGRRRPVVALGIIAVLSTATNPIFIAWAVVPLVCLLIAARRLTIRVRLEAMGALGAGAALGLLVRVPLAPWIANSGTGYVQPMEWMDSVHYYGDALADRVQAPGGLAAVIGWAMLMLLCIVLTVAAHRAERPRLAALAAVAWIVPLVVILGAVAFGTNATRYLQPIVFLPVLSLVVLCALLPAPPRALVPSVALLSAVAAAIALPSLAADAPRRYPSDDVGCVTRWVAESGRVGAGQFWTVRAPKAYAVDPRQLLQVDFELGAYEWLVNRADYDVDAVSFLLVDDQSLPFELPAGVDEADAEVIGCGSYTIVDFGEPILPLGAPHS